MKTGKFVLFKSPNDGQFYWHLKAANGEIVLQSEGYKTKQGALNGIKSVRKNAPHDERYRRLDSNDGQFYFTLTASNNEVIGVSETYTTKASRDAGIEAVKRIAPCAPLEDQTLSPEERRKQAQRMSDAQAAGNLAIISPHCKEPTPVKPKGGVYGGAARAVAKLRFRPHRQITAFNRLKEAGFIEQLTFRQGVRGRFIWEFNLGSFSFQLGNETVAVDYRLYRLRVVYSATTQPRVYVLTPKLPISTKHIYKEGNLCLYKPTNWEWQDQHRFDEELFPNICSWIYHYEHWRDTGEWIGPEAVHDPHPGFIDHLLNQMRHGRS